MTELGIGASWKSVNPQDGELRKIEGALRDPFIVSDGSLLTRRGAEVHISGLITHGIPLPESFDQYVELTNNVAKVFKDVTSSHELGGGFIIRGGNFELVPNEVKEAYDPFVKKGYELQNSLVGTNAANNIAAEIRKIRDSMILEMEQAHDENRGANLGRETTMLAENFVKLMIETGSKAEAPYINVKEAFDYFCDRLEESRYDEETKFITDEVRSRLLVAVESSGILGHSWTEAKDSAKAWLISQEGMRKLSASI